MGALATVLIADDNKDLRMLFRLMLSDYEVLEAENGIVAIDLYMKHKPELVFMDILMPEKDGIEATREILKFDSDANIIAITAYYSQAEDILNAGAKQVVKKPFRKRDLLELVAREIRSQII